MSTLIGLAQYLTMVRKEHIYLLVSSMPPNYAWEPFWKRSRISTDIILYLREVIYHKFEIAPLTRTSRIWAEKAMAPHSSPLAWKIPWTEEPGRLQSIRSLWVRHEWATSLSYIEEGNGNPFQCSCLESPRNGRAWWAAVYGVAQSWTRLKQLSSSSSRIWEASQVALVVKSQAANAGDMRDAVLISGLGRSRGGEHGNPLPYSCLENPKDRGAWWAMVHRVTESQTQLKHLSTHRRLFMLPFPIPMTYLWISLLQVRVQ